ncbi:hypothetical protein GY45DRAFT_1278586 [Cubamyces sp. BRFM 1775]|nr:hypothetical protein GY45DRAFT_1278586 [Cubamyces sp. BRFM 1775]
MDPNSGVLAPSITSLNEDILHLLVEAALLANVLKPLSITSRQMRLYCLPYLFKESTVRSVVPVKPPVFLPETVWSYVSVLHLVDRCLDQSVTHRFPDSPRSYLKFSKHALLCGVYSTEYLSIALGSMPQLHTVTFCLAADYDHGLPWSVLIGICSLPKLQNVTITNLHLVPTLLPDETLAIETPISRLISFHHTLSDYRHHRDRQYPSEERALELLLGASRDTLERLTLPMDCAPLVWVCNQLPWPRLRELRLRGELRTIGIPPFPLISMFSNMPGLRVLELKLAQPEGRDPQAFWPPSHRAISWPWPELDELTLSCPQVHDRVYAALPSSLRSLTLRYTPHYRNYTAKRVYHITPAARWQWPLLSSSDMLQILRQCRLPDLRHLSLEYHESDADDELLQYIASTYPALRCLRLFCCRRDEAEEPLGDPVIIVEHIANQLAPMQHLTRLDLQLDLPGMPKPTTSVAMMRSGAFERIGHKVATLNAWHKTQQAMVDRLLSVLSPTLSTIKLWTPASFTVHDWAVYEVVRAGDELHTHMRLERPVKRSPFLSPYS